MAIVSGSSFNIFSTDLVRFRDPRSYHPPFTDTGP
jgi:hypothetical protein